MAESAQAEALKPYINHMDKRSPLHARCCETVRQASQLDAMRCAYKRGDLAKLRSAVQHVMLDRALAELTEVQRMGDVLRDAAKYSIICENMLRKVEAVELRPSEVQALTKAASSLEKLGLGPELWKESNDTLYPLLPKVKGLLCYTESLHLLSHAFRDGSSGYCSAWLTAVEENQLTPKLETLTAKWFDAFPDSPQQLKEKLTEDDVRFSYDGFPWDERDTLIPMVRDELETLGISTSALKFRTTRSYGPDGGAVVVVSGSSDLLSSIRQITDPEGDDLLSLGTEYDRERARERAAALTLGELTLDGELTMEEPITRSKKRIIPPKPKKPEEVASERTTMKKSAPPARELQEAKVEFGTTTSPAEVVETSTLHRDPNTMQSGMSIRGKMETAERRNARIATILGQAGFAE